MLRSFSPSGPRRPPVSPGGRGQPLAWEPCYSSQQDAVISGLCCQWTPSPVPGPAEPPSGWSRGLACAGASPHTALPAGAGDAFSCSRSREPRLPLAGALATLPVQLLRRFPFSPGAGGQPRSKGPDLLEGLEVCLLWRVDRRARARGASWSAGLGSELAASPPPTRLPGLPGPRS